MLLSSAAMDTKGWGVFVCARCSHNAKNEIFYAELKYVRRAPYVHTHCIAGDLSGESQSSARDSAQKKRTQQLKQKEKNRERNKKEDGLPISHPTHRNPCFSL